MFTKNGEKIEMVATRYDYFPASFRWRGRRLDVQAVEKCWTRQQRQTQRLFRVRTEAGMFVLSFEPARGHLAGEKLAADLLAAAAGAVGRAALPVAAPPAQTGAGRADDAAGHCTQRSGA